MKRYDPQRQESANKGDVRLFKVFAAAFAPDGRQAWGRGCGRTYEIAKKHAEREIVDLFRRERIDADGIQFEYFEDL